MTAICINGYLEDLRAIAYEINYLSVVNDKYIVSEYVHSWFVDRVSEVREMVKLGLNRFEGAEFDKNERDP